MPYLKGSLCRGLARWRGRVPFPASARRACMRLCAHGSPTSFTGCVRP